MSAMIANGHIEKRSMKLAGLRTSVALEPAFWAQAEAEAARLRVSLPTYIVSIDNSSFVSVLRSAKLAERHDARKTLQPRPRRPPAPLDISPEIEARRLACLQKDKTTDDGALQPVKKCCPTCRSSDAHYHPSMQPEGGEVEICPDEFHLQRTVQNKPEYIAAVEAKRALLGLDIQKERDA